MQYLYPYYNCSCTDNIIKMNICKHIQYACAREFNLAFDSAPIFNKVTNIEEQQILFKMQLILTRCDLGLNKNTVKKNRNDFRTELYK